MYTDRTTAECECMSRFYLQPGLPISPLIPSLPSPPLSGRRRGKEKKKTHLQKPLLMENAAVCKFARWESMETACKARSDSTVGLLAESHMGTELWFHMVQHVAWVTDQKHVSPILHGEALWLTLRWVRAKDNKPGAAWKHMWIMQSRKCMSDPCEYQEEPFKKA